MAQDRTLTPRAPGLGRLSPAFATGHAGSVVPFLATLLAVFIAVSKVQETLLPFLQSARPALLTLVLATGLTLLLGGAAGHRFRLTRELAIYLSLAAIGLALVPVSVWPGGALDGVVYIFVPQILMMVAVRANVADERAFRWIVRAMLAGMMVLAVGAWLAPQSDFGRVSTGFTYDANDLGLIFVCCLPLAIPDLVTGGFVARIFAAGVLLTGTVGILRTGSRGALLGLAAAGLYFMLRRTDRLPRWLKIAAIVVVGVLIASRISDLFVERIQAIVEGSDYNLTTGRLAIWSRAAEIAVRRPMGVGAGQFGAALGLYTGGRDWHTAHNSFIQVLVELGFAGLILFLLLLYGAWRDAGRAATALGLAGPRAPGRLDAQCARATLVGYVASGMFLSQAYLVLLPVLVAALAGLREAAERNAAGLEPLPREEPRAGRAFLRGRPAPTVARPT